VDLDFMVCAHGRENCPLARASSSQRGGGVFFDSFGAQGNYLMVAEERPLCQRQDLLDLGRLDQTGLRRTEWVDALLRENRMNLWGWVWLV
jgi:hypothetical protein